MQGCRPTSTPMEPDHKLNVGREHAFVDKERYQCLIGRDENIVIYRVSEGFDTIYHGDILERRKFGKYRQKIIDISVGGNKSPIFPINQLSWQKLSDISTIYHRFFGDILGKKKKAHSSLSKPALAFNFLQLKKCLPMFASKGTRTPYYNICLPLGQLCPL